MAAVASHLASSDGVTLTSVLPTLANVGAASTALEAERTWQLLVSGNAYDPDANNIVELAATIGGTTVARYAGSQAFGASPAGALGAQQIAGAMLFVTGEAETPTLQWQGGSAGDGDGLASGMRLLAVDVTDIPLGNGRYSSQSANTDTADAGPGSGDGWTTVQTLTFTPARAGSHFCLASMELVPNGSATATQQTAARLVVGGTPVAGQAVVMDIGPVPTSIQRGFFAISGGVLDDETEYVVELQVNGALGGGNVDTRRRAIQVYESALWESAAVTQQSAGLTLAAGVTDFVPGVDVTIPAPAAARRIVALYAGPSQTGFWKQGQFVVGDATVISPGFGSATNDIGNTAADDAMHDHGLYTADAVDAETRVRVQYGQFGAGGGGGMVVGQAVTVADASGPGALLTLVLDVTPPAEVTDQDMPGMADTVGGMSASMSMQVESFIIADDEIGGMDGSLSMHVDQVVPGLVDSIGGLTELLTVSVEETPGIPFPGMSDTLGGLDASLAFSVDQALPGMASAMGGIDGSLVMMASGDIEFPALADTIGGIDGSMVMTSVETVSEEWLESIDASSYTFETRR